MIAAEISRALGGHRVGRQWMARCPAHAGGGERTGSLSLRDGYAGVVVHCFAGCDFRDIRDALVDRGLWPARPDRDDEEARRKRQERARKASAYHLEAEAEDRAKALRDLRIAKEILRDALAPTPDSIVGRYLTGRGLDPPWPACIREHPRLYHRDDSGRVTHWPALVAPVRDSRTNAIRGVHRLWLQPDGTKAPVDTCRKILGRGGGGAVKLSPDCAVTLGLGLVEGVEDGLDVLQRGWAPVWALLGRQNIERFPVLSGVEHITVFADRDDPGMGAAKACARRWRAAGLRSDIVPPRAAKDWNAEERP